jgi:hypothetical protein
VSRLKRFATRVLHEPLAHFLILGGLVFALDYSLGDSAANQRVIRVDDSLVGELREMFESGQGRPPTTREMDSLLYRWVQNEVLYREALARGLDQGDDMIRERMVTKLRQVMMDSIVVDRPTDDELRSWFGENRRYYELPERYDFEQVGLGVESAEDAVARVAAMNGGEFPGDLIDRIKRYEGRPRANIEQMFGAGFATTLLARPGEHWLAVQSNEGWHAARVSRVLPAAPAKLEAVRLQAETEWKHLQQKQEAADAIAAIRARYEIRMDLGS